MNEGFGANQEGSINPGVILSLSKDGIIEMRCFDKLSMT